MRLLIKKTLISNHLTASITVFHIIVILYLVTINYSTTMFPKNVIIFTILLCFLSCNDQKKTTEVAYLSAAAVHELSTPLNTIFLVLNDLLKEKIFVKNSFLMNDVTMFVKRKLLFFNCFYHCR